MQLNKTTDYALRMLYFLGRENRVVPSSEMAKSLQISQRYLLNVAKQLKNFGYIHADMGVDGGYSLIRPLNEINLYDIVKPMEGTVVILRCLSPNKHCDDGVCVFDEVYGFLQNILECYLQNLNIEMLMDYPVDEWHDVIMSKICTMYRQQQKADENPMI